MINNRNYSRNIMVCCPKCHNTINLKETINVSTNVEADNMASLSKISAMEIYGVEHSQYACTECGTYMNNCDVRLYKLFNELQNLPHNICMPSAIGTIGGCTGSSTINMLNAPHEKNYSYPSILFFNSDREIVNGLISVISETVGEDNTYENIRLQIIPIGKDDKDGNPIENLLHFKIAIFVDGQFTNDEEKYNLAVEVFTNFINLISDPIAAFGIQERERVAIKAEEERLVVEDTHFDGNSDDEETIM